MKNVAFTWLSLGVFAGMILLSSAAQAHDTWVVPSTYQAAQKTLPGLTVFNSHHFPAPEADGLPADRIEALSYVSASGKPVAMGQKTDETGTFLGVAVPVNGFFTKTPEGYQRGKSKKEVKNPIVCTKSVKFAKTIFSVGQAGGDAWANALGQDMEIVPLKDPSSLKAGDTLPVKVLMDGKPVRTQVLGTYEGFSDVANTFGYATWTDKAGVAQIKLIHNGPWLLIAKHEQPYPDLSECDVQRWAAALTFKIQ